MKSETLVKMTNIDVNQLPNFAIIGLEFENDNLIIAIMRIHSVEGRTIPQSF